MGCRHLPTQSIHARSCTAVKKQFFMLLCIQIFTLIDQEENKRHSKRQLLVYLRLQTSAKTPFQLAHPRLEDTHDAYM